MDVITVYTTGPACIRCTMTKNVLAQRGIEYTEVDIRENAGAREYVVDELGYTEAPVVVVDDEDHWSGFRPDQIERIAAQGGDAASQSAAANAHNTTKTTNTSKTTDHWRTA